MAKFSEPNTDGTVIATLEHAIKLPDGEETNRITIPALTGRHVMRMGWHGGERPTIGELSTFAASVVQPAGSYERLAPRDALDVMNHVSEALGKALSPTGANASP